MKIRTFSNTGFAFAMAKFNMIMRTRILFANSQSEPGSCTALINISEPEKKHFGETPR